MADLHIVRHHTLGLLHAREVAFKWAENAEAEFGMRCTYEEGKSADEVTFARSGVQGSLSVTKDKFELQAKLGFLLGAFQARIESEIIQNLDELLTPKPKHTSRAPAKPHAGNSQ